MTTRLYIPSADELADPTRFPVWLDHTRASALHTCHFWGMVRYINNKTVTEEARAIPLEAGGAAHQAFAAQRVWQLARAGRAPAGALATPYYAAVLNTNRIFGSERGAELVPLLDGDEQQFVLKVLETSGFYDDPSDRRRTMSNITDAVLHYLQRYEGDSYPVYVGEELTGIEVPICYAIEFDETHRVLYRGRLDAICMDGEDAIVVENKTTSRISRDWSVQWDVSHQITGYCVGASLMLNREVNRAAVPGLQIPMPKGDPYSGYVFHNTSRSRFQVATFLQWVDAAYRVWFSFKDQPFEATRLTHSCFRYFRPCAFVPLCYLGDGDPPLSMDELTDAPWHPEVTE